MQIQAVDVAQLHVILCFAFDHRSSASEIERFKQGLIQSPDVCHAIETSGTYDFMAEFALPDFAAYYACLKQLAEPIARIVIRYEASFVCRRYVSLEHKRPVELWVPTRDGLRRIECDKVDVVRAEGDYVRIHSADQSWLLGATMTAVFEQLDDERFLHLHRSVIVRRDFIERLSHREGRWIAHLIDGTTQRIAKSRVSETIGHLRGHLATSIRHSASQQQSHDATGHVTESESRAPAS